MLHFAITSLFLLKLKRATVLLKILGFGGLLFSVFNQLCNVQCVWFSFYILFIVFTLFYAQHLLIRTQLLLSPYWMDYGTSLTMSWEKPRCAWCLRPWVPTFWPSSRGPKTYARWDGLVFPTAALKLNLCRYNFKGIPLDIVRKVTTHTLIGLDYLWLDTSN